MSSDITQQQRQIAASTPRQSATKLSQLQLTAVRSARVSISPSKALTHGDLKLPDGERYIVPEAAEMSAEELQQWLETDHVAEANIALEDLLVAAKTHGLESEQYQSACEMYCAKQATVFSEFQMQIHKAEYEIKQSQTEIARIESEKSKSLSFKDVAFGPLAVLKHSLFETPKKLLGFDKACDAAVETEKSLISAKEQRLEELKALKTNAEGNFDATMRAITKEELQDARTLHKKTQLDLSQKAGLSKEVLQQQVEQLDAVKHKFDAAASKADVAYSVTKVVRNVAFAVAAASASGLVGAWMLGSSFLVGAGWLATVGASALSGLIGGLLVYGVSGGISNICHAFASMAIEGSSIAQARALFFANQKEDRQAILLNIIPAGVVTYLAKSTVLAKALSNIPGRFLGKFLRETPSATTPLSQGLANGLTAAQAKVQGVLLGSAYGTSSSITNNTYQIFFNTTEITVTNQDENGQPVVTTRSMPLFRPELTHASFVQKVKTIGYEALVDGLIGGLSAKFGADAASRGASSNIFGKMFHNTAGGTKAIATDAAGTFVKSWEKDILLTPEYITQSLASGLAGYSLGGQMMNDIISSRKLPSQNFQTQFNSDPSVTPASFKPSADGSDAPKIDFFRFLTTSENSSGNTSTPRTRLDLDAHPLEHEYTQGVVDDLAKSGVRIVADTRTPKEIPEAEHEDKTQLYDIDGNLVEEIDNTPKLDEVSQRILDDSTLLKSEEQSIGQRYRVRQNGNTIEIIIDGNNATFGTLAEIHAQVHYEKHVVQAAKDLASEFGIPWEGLGSFIKRADVIDSPVLTRIGQDPKFETLSRAIRTSRQFGLAADDINQSLPNMYDQKFQVPENRLLDDLTVTDTTAETIPKQQVHVDPNQLLLTAPEQKQKQQSATKVNEALLRIDGYRENWSELKTFLINDFHIHMHRAGYNTQPEITAQYPQSEYAHRSTTTTDSIGRVKATSPKLKSTDYSQIEQLRRENREIEERRLWNKSREDLTVEGRNRLDELLYPRLQRQEGDIAANDNLSRNDMRAFDSEVRDFQKNLKKMRNPETEIGRDMAMLRKVTVRDRTSSDRSFKESLDLWSLERMQKKDEKLPKSDKQLQEWHKKYLKSLQKEEAPTVDLSASRNEQNQQLQKRIDFVAKELAAADLRSSRSIVSTYPLYLKNKGYREAATQMVMTEHKINTTRARLYYKAASVADACRLTPLEQSQYAALKKQKEMAEISGTTLSSKDQKRLEHFDRLVSTVETARLLRDDIRSGENWLRRPDIRRRTPIDFTYIQRDEYHALLARSDDEVIARMRTAQHTDSWLSNILGPLTPWRNSLSWRRYLYGFRNPEDVFRAQYWARRTQDKIGDWNNKLHRWPSSIGNVFARVAPWGIGFGSAAYIGEDYKNNLAGLNGWKDLQHLENDFSRLSYIQAANVYRQFKNAMSSFEIMFHEESLDNIAGKYNFNLLAHVDPHHERRLGKYNLEDGPFVAIYPKGVKSGDHFHKTVEQLRADNYLVMSFKEFYALSKKVNDHPAMKLYEQGEELQSNLRYLRPTDQGFAFGQHLDWRNMKVVERDHAATNEKVASGESLDVNDYLLEIPSTNKREPALIKSAKEIQSMIDGTAKYQAQELLTLKDATLPLLQSLPEDHYLRREHYDGFDWDKAEFTLGNGGITLKVSKCGFFDNIFGFFIPVLAEEKSYSLTALSNLKYTAQNEIAGSQRTK